MSTRRESNEILAGMNRAEKADLLQQLLAELDESFPGIETREGVAGGVPCIVRTRIPVWLLEQARRLGTSDADLLREVAEAFVAESPRLLSEMRAAIEEVNFRKLEHSAHSYKGAVSLFSSAPAVSLASDLEQMGATQDLTGAERHLTLLQDYAESLCSVLTEMGGEKLCVS